MAVRALVVDRIKRRAIRVLHDTRRGEALLLAIYLWAEELTETAVLDDARAGAQPGWLREQVERHASDERRHAALLRGRLARLGEEPPSIDGPSRRKLEKIRALARDAAPDFREPLVTPLAVAWRMELMGVRVMSRHLDVLERLEAKDGRPRDAAPLIRRILADERGHVDGCERALVRLVANDERDALARLVERVDRVERSWSISGAVALLAIGAWWRAVA